MKIGDTPDLGGGVVLAILFLAFGALGSMLGPRPNTDKS